MINFEDLKEKNVKEVQEILERDNAEFKAALEVMSEDELNEQERVLLEALDAYDKRLDEVNYILPEKAEFDNREFSKTQISNMIVDFVNKQEVEWSYSLGMYQMCKLWKAIAKGIQADINYKALDTTLRLLGGLKYKGYEEWRGILAVNQFLTGIHDEYNKDTTYLIYLSHMHSEVLSKMQKESEPIMESENV